MHGYDREVVVSAVVSSLVLLVLLWLRRSGRRRFEAGEKSCCLNAHFLGVFEESKGGIHAV